MIWMSKVSLSRTPEICPTCSSHSDKAWLDALNRDRRKEQMTTITYEQFEVIMDRLEKEWFDLVSCVVIPPSFVSQA